MRDEVLMRILGLMRLILLLKMLLAWMLLAWMLLAWMLLAWMIRVRRILLLLSLVARSMVMVVRSKFLSWLWWPIVGEFWFRSVGFVCTAWRRRSVVALVPHFTPVTAVRLGVRYFARVREWASYCCIYFDCRFSW